jgi:hypothetical protein
MGYEIDKTQWWLLQVQLPERYGKQQDLFSTPIPRQDLLRQSVSLIPENIRISRGNSTWGLADLVKINDDLFSFYLTIRSPYARIAEEPEPGHLKDAKDPRYYTLCIINIPKQIVMVHKTSDVSRFARSARTFADIFQELLEKAVSSLNMGQHYLVEVDPIAKTGSFVEWVNGLDILKKIIIKYTGSNLPSGASNLIADLKESAKQLKSALKSKEVELVANEPALNDEEVVELDRAVADRRLKLRARGIKSGVGTTWSSSEKPIPETAIMPIDEDQLHDEVAVARRIDIYINARFEGR